MKIPRSNKSKKKFGKKKEDPLENLKIEVAQNLGLINKVKKYGWSGLTASESGKIGGIMTRILSDERNS